MAKRSTESVELKSIVDELEVVRLDRHGAPLGVLPRIRELVGLEAVVFLRLVEKLNGWAVEGFESDGLSNPSRARRCITDYLASHHETMPWLDLARPAQTHCNRVVALEELVPDEDLRKSSLYGAVLRPLELHDRRFARILLYDAATCGWFGAISSRPLSDDQRTQLEQLVAPLLSRLRMERLLASAPRIHAALEATLHHIGAPALVVDTRGRIHELNRAARDLLTKQRMQVQTSLRDLVEGRSPELPFALTPIEGGHRQFLAVLRPRSAAEQRQLAVSLAAYRWKLTARQVQVLERIIRGNSNSEISSDLGISERATEMHVSTLFDRARVSNRAQLVAAVLLT